MLAMTAEGPQRFGELYLLILLVNVTGVIALLVLIGGRLADFVRDWRRHVPGSRLRGRTLLMFGGLAIAPLLLVFTFSVMFLTRGIDSWFHAEIRQGLTDALGLSRAALDLRMREYLDRTVRIAARLEGLSEGALYFALDDELRAAGRRGVRGHERGRAAGRVQPRGHAAFAAGRAAGGPADAAAAGPAQREPAAGARRRLPGARGDADPRRARRRPRCC